MSNDIETTRVCQVDGCDRPLKYVGHGYCSAHGARFFRTGDVQADRPIGVYAERPTCVIADCDNPIAYSDGFCKAHHMRVVKHDDPMEDIPIGSTGKFFPKEREPCCVDGCVADARYFGMCWLHYGRWRNKGSVGTPERYKSDGYTVGSGYRYIHVDGQKHLEHRYVIEQVIGRPLERHENVHHINGIRDDNRLENLELWVSSQPSGQRVQDLIAWAHEILDRYES